MNRSVWSAKDGLTLTSPTEPRSARLLLDLDVTRLKQSGIRTLWRDADNSVTDDYGVVDSASAVWERQSVTNGDPRRLTQPFGTRPGSVRTTSA